MLLLNRILPVLHLFLIQESIQKTSDLSTLCGSYQDGAWVLKFSLVSKYHKERNVGCTSIGLLIYPDIIEAFQKAWGGGMIDRNEIARKM